MNFIRIWMNIKEKVFDIFDIFLKDNIVVRLFGILYGTFRVWRTRQISSRVNISNIGNSSRGQNFRLWQSGGEGLRSEMRSFPPLNWTNTAAGVEYNKTHATSIDLQSGALLGRLGKLTDWLTDWLTDSLIIIKLDCVWRCKLKTCWGCYCYSCWYWCWGSYWQQFVTD